MKKILYILLVFAVFSCKKESDTPIATLRISNFTSDTSRLLATINRDTVRWTNSLYSSSSVTVAIDAANNNQLVVEDKLSNSVILSTSLGTVNRNDRLLAFILDNPNTATMTTVNLNTEFPNDTAIGIKFANFSFNSPSVLFTLDGDTVATGLDFKAVSSDFYFTNKRTHIVRVIRESDGTLLKSKNITLDKGLPYILYIKGDKDILNGYYKFDIDVVN